MPATRAEAPAGVRVGHPDWGPCGSPLRRRGSRGSFRTAAADMRPASSSASAAAATRRCEAGGVGAKARAVAFWLAVVLLLGLSALGLQSAIGELASGLTPG